MNLSLSEQREELARELRQLADIEPENWTPEHQQRWDEQNTQYDALIEQIQGDSGYRDRRQRLDFLTDQAKRGFVPGRDSNGTPSVPGEQQRTAGPSGTRLRVNGEETRCFTPEDSIAAWQDEIRHRDLPSTSELSLDRYCRAAALGDWSLAPAEFEVAKYEKRALDLSSGAITVPVLVSSRWYDRLRERMRVLQAGTQMVELLSENTKFAKIDGELTFDIGKSENAPFSEDTVTLGGVTMTPFTIGQITRTSQELLQDGINVDAMITEELSRGLAQQLDKLALTGSGVGQPRGIQVTGWNIPETAVTGPMDWLVYSNACQKLREQNSEPLAAILTPKGHNQLHLHATGDGATSAAAWRGNPGHITPDDRILYSMNCDPAKATLGDWGSALWGTRFGVEMRVTDRSAGAFERYQLAYRIVVRFDFAVIRPNSFVTLTGLT